MPTKRPTFTDLVSQIDSMLESGSNYMDLHVNTASECYLDQKALNTAGCSVDDCEAAGADNIDKRYAGIIEIEASRLTIWFQKVCVSSDSRGS